MRTTKIVATLGPSTDAPGKLRQLFEAGVDVFRLNFSHGTQEDHAGRISSVRAMQKELGVHAGILMDLQGPKIRLGTFANGGCMLDEGKEFVITTEPGVTGTCSRATTTYPNLRAT
jgi:pyruvate kinase